MLTDTLIATVLGLPEEVRVALLSVPGNGLWIRAKSYGLSPSVVWFDAPPPAGETDKRDFWMPSDSLAILSVASDLYSQTARGRDCWPHAARAIGRKWVLYLMATDAETAVVSRERRPVGGGGGNAGGVPWMTDPISTARTAASRCFRRPAADGVTRTRTSFSTQTRAVAGGAIGFGGRRASRPRATAARDARSRWTRTGRMRIWLRSKFQTSQNHDPAATHLVTTDANGQYHERNRPISGSVTSAALARATRIMAAKRAGAIRSLMHAALVEANMDVYRQSVGPVPGCFGGTWSGRRNTEHAPR
jgi:hypothetical protein